MADEWTIGRLLNWTADYLKQHGSESPRLEAEVLLAHARGCQRIELYTSFGDEADEALRTKFRALVKRRAEGVPVAYLVGHREFYSLDFRVTPGVLIPRPETELLVLAVLDLVKAMPGEGTVNVADVGTGSGIVAIAAAGSTTTSGISLCWMSMTTTGTRATVITATAMPLPFAPNARIEPAARSPVASSSAG